jgi:hypothetical protein
MGLVGFSFFLGIIHWYCVLYSIISKKHVSFVPIVAFVIGLLGVALAPWQSGFKWLLPLAADSCEAMFVVIVAFKMATDRRYRP